MAYPLNEVAHFLTFVRWSAARWSVGRLLCLQQRQNGCRGGLKKKQHKFKTLIKIPQTTQITCLRLFHGIINSKETADCIKKQVNELKSGPVNEWMRRACVPMPAYPNPLAWFIINIFASPCRGVWLQDANRDGWRGRRL